MKNNKLGWVFGILGAIAAIILATVRYTGDLTITPSSLSAQDIRAAYNNQTKGIVFSGMNITAFPDVCRYLPASTQKKVEHLVVNHTPLTHLDRDVSCLTHLKTVNLSKNNLVSIENFVTSRELKHLSLAENKLVTLDGLGIYPNLETLKVYNNNLTNVDQANNYKLLSTFLLQNNNLKDISKLRLKNIKEINVEGNPLDPETIATLNTFSEKNKENN